MDLSLSINTSSGHGGTAPDPILGLNPLLAWRASSASGVGDGNAVTSITDLSAYAYTISAPSTGPAYRADAKGTGYPGLEFDGTDATALTADGATAAKAAFSGDPEYTLIAVVYADATTGTILGAHDGTAYCQNRTNGGGNLRTLHRGDLGGTNAENSNDSTTNSQVQIWTWTVDPAADTVSWTIDGVDAGDDAFAITDTIAAVSGITIGAQRTPTYLQPFDGVIFEQYLFGSLSGANRTIAVNALKASYGIT